MLDWDNWQKWSVLVVDDEKDNAEVVALALRFYGLVVVVAENGAEGLELLQEFTPDLILLDLSMPKMDGWEMRTRVKADPRLQAVPIVALSAHAMNGDKERALISGFDGYLTKPISIPTFIKDLRRAIDEGATFARRSHPTPAATPAPSRPGNGSVVSTTYSKEVSS